MRKRQHNDPNTSAIEHLTSPQRFAAEFETIKPGTHLHLTHFPSMTPLPPSAGVNPRLPREGSMMTPICLVPTRTRSLLVGLREIWWMGKSMSGFRRICSRMTKNSEVIYFSVRQERECSSRK